MPSIQIGRFQAVTILANLVYGKSLGFTAGVIARRVGNDLWISMLIAFATGAIIMIATSQLTRVYGTQTPTEYFPRLAGRPLGTLFLILMALFFAGSFITSGITVEFHLNDFLMTETPLIVFVVVYTLLVLYGAYLGLEVAARLSVWGLFAGLLLALSMIAGSLDRFSFDRLLPLFDHGVTDVVLASLIADTDVAMAVAASLFLFPYVQRQGNWIGLSWLGLFYGALQSMAWPIFEVAVLGPEVTAQYLIACMQLGRASELSIYVHRYEMIMMILFASGVLAKSIVLLYLAFETISSALKLKRLGRGTAFAIFSLFTLPLHYWLASDRQLYNLFLDTWWPLISLPIAFGIPLALALLMLVRSLMGNLPEGGR